MSNTMKVKDSKNIIQRLRRKKEKRHKKRKPIKTQELVTGGYGGHMQQGMKDTPSVYHLESFPDRASRRMEVGPAGG